MLPSLHNHITLIHSCVADTGPVGFSPFVLDLKKDKGTVPAAIPCTLVIHLVSSYEGLQRVLRDEIVNPLRQVNNKAYFSRIFTSLSEPLKPQKVKLSAEKENFLFK